MAIAYLSLATNDGKMKKNINEAFHHIARHHKILKRSSLYKSDDPSIPDPFYINCVIKIDTDYNPYKLLEFCQRLEKAQMKQKLLFLRSHKTIDIDILFYDDLILIDERLIIPHPGAHKRTRVLVPMNEIEPDFIHPMHHKKMSDYPLDRAQVIRLNSIEF